MSKLIYVADDDEAIRNLLHSFLTRDDYMVEVFPDGNGLLAACEVRPPDLVLLDIMMPGEDGLSVCSTLRTTYPKILIIIISAKGTPYDRVTGLTIGCDDYLSKPFLPIELLARVNALFRRSQIQTADTKPKQELQFGPLTLYPEQRFAVLAGSELILTPTEFDFLALLIEREGNAVSREELVNRVWKVNWSKDTRATDDLVKRLRKKLRAFNNAVSVETVWGYGFRLSLERPI